jgi:hypothetical protein
VPFVAHLRPPLTVSELTSAVEGKLVKVFVLKGIFVRSKGIVVKIQIVLRACA